MKILHIPITNFNLDDTSYEEGNSDATVHVSKTFGLAFKFEKHTALKKG